MYFKETVLSDHLLKYQGIRILKEHKTIKTKDLITSQDSTTPTKSDVIVLYEHCWHNSQILQLMQILCSLCCTVFLQMSFTEELPDMEGEDLLGLLFHGEEGGSVEPLFPVENGLIESWLSEQDVSLNL